MGTRLTEGNNCHLPLVLGMPRSCCVRNFIAAPGIKQDAGHIIVIHRGCGKIVETDGGEAGISGRSPEGVSTR